MYWNWIEPFWGAKAEKVNFYQLFTNWTPPFGTVRKLDFVSFEPDAARLDGFLVGPDCDFIKFFRIYWFFWLNSSREFNFDTGFPINLINVNFFSICRPEFSVLWDLVLESAWNGQSDAACLACFFEKVVKTG